MKLSLPKEQMEFLKSIGIEDREYSQEEIDDVVIDALVGKRIPIRNTRKRMRLAICVKTS